MDADDSSDDSLDLLDDCVVDLADVSPGCRLVDVVTSEGKQLDEFSSVVASDDTQF